MPPRVSKSSPTAVQNTEQTNIMSPDVPQPSPLWKKRLLWALAIAVAIPVTFFVVLFLLEWVALSLEIKTLPSQIVWDYVARPLTDVYYWVGSVIAEVMHAAWEFVKHAFANFTTALVNTFSPVARMFFFVDVLRGYWETITAYYPSVFVADAFDFLTMLPAIGFFLQLLFFFISLIIVGGFVIKGVGKVGDHENSSS